jgi:hypothetical protein
MIRGMNKSLDPGPASRSRTRRFAAAGSLLAARRNALEFFIQS